MRVTVRGALGSLAGVVVTGNTGDVPGLVLGYGVSPTRPRSSTLQLERHPKSVKINGLSLISIDFRWFTMIFIDFHCFSLISIVFWMICVVKKNSLPALKSMQLAEFLIFFQNSGSYVKLRTRTIHFRRENTAGGIMRVGKSSNQRNSKKGTPFRAFTLKSVFRIAKSHHRPVGGGSDI